MYQMLICMKINPDTCRLRPVKVDICLILNYYFTGSDCTIYG